MNSKLNSRNGPGLKLLPRSWFSYEDQPKTTIYWLVCKRETVKYNRLNYLSRSQLRSVTVTRTRRIYPTGFILNYSPGRKKYDHLLNPANLRRETHYLLPSSLPRLPDTLAQILTCQQQLLTRLSQSLLRVEEATANHLQWSRRFNLTGNLFLKAGGSRHLFSCQVCGRNSQLSRIEINGRGFHSL